jgi:hypothetical protein
MNKGEKNIFTLSRVYTDSSIENRINDGINEVGDFRLSQVGLLESQTMIILGNGLSATRPRALRNVGLGALGLGALGLGALRNVGLGHSA